MKKLLGTRRLQASAFTLGRARRLLGLTVGALLLTAILASPVGAQNEPKQEKAAKTVRLLTVGNSFSGNATQFLDVLAKGGGHKLIHHTCSIGGAAFSVHWARIDLNEKDPKDPRGLYGKLSLKQQLVAEPWDFITIQQASIKSHDAETYRPHAKKLYDYLHQHAPKSEIVLHETWAYRVDDPRFGKPSKTPGEPTTQKAMYEGLSAAYEKIAKELKVRIIPVGDAFFRADQDAQWGYKVDTAFDSKSAKPPTLPDQAHSLHVGYRWTAVKGKEPNMNLGMDGHHASTAGQYLAGCVFYEFLFGENVVGNPYIPKSLDPAYARFLQETAHRAVVDRRKDK